MIAAQDLFAVDLDLVSVGASREQRVRPARRERPNARHLLPLAGYSRTVE